MLDKINRIAELENLISKKSKEIEPIKMLISLSSYEVESIKIEIVEKNVEKGKWYHLNEPVDADYFLTSAFKIISVDWHTETECILRLVSGADTSTFLSHSDIFNMFLKSEEYQKMVREKNLNNIIGDE